MREQARGVVDDPDPDLPAADAPAGGRSPRTPSSRRRSPTACAEALEKRVICDLYEGNAPHRPRYVLPDYATLLRDGSAFLELGPARDLDEALAHLLIAYTQVPSITGYPVWLGDLDALLEPYVGGVDDERLHRRLRLFWISLDRMLPDAFTHANLGPHDTRVGRMALRLERELLQVVPNLSLKVDPDLTPDDLVRDAVETVFACGQPHFVNHPMMVAGLGAGVRRGVLLQLAARGRRLAHAGAAEPARGRAAAPGLAGRPSSTTCCRTTSSSPPS